MEISIIGVGPQTKMILPRCRNNIKYFWVIANYLV